jgi:uncharacterized protein YmfQ (DUF2313 family)
MANRVSQVDVQALGVGSPKVRVSLGNIKVLGIGKPKARFSLGNVQFLWCPPPSFGEMAAITPKPVASASGSVTAIVRIGATTPVPIASASLSSTKAPVTSSGRRALALLATDFLGAFQRLMPRGPIWPRDMDTNQAQTLLALQPTYVRSTNAANALLVDAFPATAVNLLPEWEETLGLPDPCAGTDPLISDRQAQVVARLTGRGKNQSQAFYIGYAASLGYPITITQFAPFKAGSKAGSPCYSAAWAYAWQINAPTFTVKKFKAGDAAGSPLATWGNTVLQCEMQRLAPAHTVLLFNYS